MTGETFLGRLDVETNLSQTRLAFAGLALVTATAIAVELLQSSAPSEDVAAVSALTPLPWQIRSIPASATPGAMNSMASLSRPGHSAFLASLPDHAKETSEAGMEDLQAPTTEPKRPFAFREPADSEQVATSAFASSQATPPAHGEDASNDAPARPRLAPRRYQPLARSFRPFRPGRAAATDFAAVVQTANSRSNQTGRSSTALLSTPEDAVDALADAVGSPSGFDSSVSAGRAKALKGQAARCAALDRSCGGKFAGSCGDIRRFAGRGAEEGADLAAALARLGSKVESCEAQAQNLGCSDVPSLTRVQADIAGFCQMGAQ